MKIAIDCRMLNSGGIGTFLNGVLIYLLQDVSLEFVLFGDKNCLSNFVSRNVEIVDCPIKIFSLSELLQFPVFQVNKCDCFFTPNYNIPLGIRVPIYSTIHDVLFLDDRSLTSYIGYLIRKFYLYRSASISKHIFTVSEFSKSRIIYHIHSTKNITVCYNGVEDVHKFTINDKRICPERYFLFVGNIKPHKGLKTLLQAYKLLDNPDYKLIVAGEIGNFKTKADDIIEVLSSLPEADNVIVTGKISRDDLLSLIQNAYCLIQPSEYEGFGIPPLEAMFLGTPVILSDIPVFKELYSRFPVRYFKRSDPQSLLDEMLKPMQRVMLREDLRNLYSYKKSAGILLKKIKSDLNLL